MFRNNVIAIIGRALKPIPRLFAGSRGVHSEGFWVKGGSLVYIPAGQVHEVQKVIQEHREREAKIALQRMMMHS